MASYINVNIRELQVRQIYEKFISNKYDIYVFFKFLNHFGSGEFRKEKEETTMAKYERPKFCTDRILPRNIMAAQRVMRMSDGKTSAIAIKNKPWMNGSTLHVRFMDGTAREQATAQEQASWWMEVANIRFVFDNAPNAEIRIKFDENDGAWSYIGTDCRVIPVNEPTMNLGFLDGGTAAHEFGHAIGLAHEHQNPKGGIEWNEDVVIAELAKPPNSWDEATTRHNVLNKYSADQIMGTEFDPDSIMLYFFPASWTKNGIGTSRTMCFQDGQGVRCRCKDVPEGRAYHPGRREAHSQREARTKGSIGKHGEEDLYTFTAESEGRYVIDTMGKTDVVMKLFGPDNETALIAEDDDSGVGTNARISAELIPGTYYVQVRHYSRKSGTGDYTIKVIRK